MNVFFFFLFSQVHHHHQLLWPVSEHSEHERRPVSELPVLSSDRGGGVRADVAPDQGGAEASAHYRSTAERWPRPAAYPRRPSR